MTSSGSFPKPQYCRGMQQLLYNSEGELRSAVLLAGDAVHAFPPDLGQVSASAAGRHSSHLCTEYLSVLLRVFQGINSAFADLFALHLALQLSGGDLKRGGYFVSDDTQDLSIEPHLSLTALTQYEAQQAPQAAALVR